MKSELLVLMYIKNNYDMVDNRIQMFFGQTISNWNLLVLCDNPYLKSDYMKIKKKYDINRNIIFIENEICNQGSTYNLGICYFLQHGYKYLVILNDYDKYYPNFLNILMNEQKMFTYGNYHQRKESQKPILCYKNMKDFICNSHGLCNTMWSKEAIKIIGLFDEKKGYASLFDYYVRSFYHFDENQIGYIEQPTHTCICEFNQQKKEENIDINQLKEMCQKFDDDYFMELLKNVAIQRNIKTGLSEKLFYKLTLYNGCIVKLLRNGLEQCMIKYNNCVVSINDITRNVEFCIFTIWKNDNKYKLCINNEFIIEISDYDNIQLISNNHSYYNLSINYALSVQNFNATNWENFNYLLTTFPNMNKKYQLNICHIDPFNTNNIDHIIEKTNCNYIYVEKPDIYKFNLGYLRNLYKYLSFSNNIMFSDIDIPIPNEILNDMVVKLNKENYDVVKPYTNNIVYTNIEQKRDWLNNYTFNYNNFKKFTSTLVNTTQKLLFTISGGIVVIKKDLLEQIGGFNEIQGYAYEDRFMDVHLLNIPNLKIFKFENKLFHLYHYANRKDETTNLQQLKKEYNKKYYSCLFKKDATKDLHEFCNHETKYLSLIEKFHQQTNGDLQLFKKSVHMLNYLTLKRLPF